jgi:orotate phosphoribosyltransferase-like protein
MIKAKELKDQGLSQRAIKDELGISLGTVNKYLKQVEKLNTRKDEIYFPPGSDPDEILEARAIMEG